LNSPRAARAEALLMPRYLLFGLFTAACCSSCTLAVDCYTTSGMNLTDCDRWLACKVSKGMLCDNGLGKLGTVLMMGGHQVQGTVPNDDLAEMTGLTSLSLASNFALTGPIPSAIGSLRFLNDLDLHNNTLNGTIPAAIGALSEIFLLDLSGNEFTGAEAGICPIVGNTAWQLCTLSPNPAWTDGAQCPTCLNKGACKPPVACAATDYLGR
jgi:hypothetical protein